MEHRIPGPVCPPSAPGPAPRQLRSSAQLLGCRPSAGTSLLTCDAQMSFMRVEGGKRHVMAHKPLALKVATATPPTGLCRLWNDALCRHSERMLRRNDVA